MMKEKVKEKMNLNEFLDLGGIKNKLILPSTPGEIESNFENYPNKFRSNTYKNKNQEFKELKEIKENTYLYNKDEGILNIEGRSLYEKDLDPIHFGEKNNDNRNIIIKHPFSKKKYADSSSSKFNNFDRSKFGSKIIKTSTSSINLSNYPINNFKCDPTPHGFGNDLVKNSFEEATRVFSNKIKQTEKYEKMISTKKEINKKKIINQKLRKKEREKRLQFQKDLRVLTSKDLETRSLETEILQMMLPSFRCNLLKDTKILGLIFSNIISKQIISVQELLIMLPQKEKDNIVVDFFSNLLKDQGEEIFFNVLKIEGIDPLKVFEDIKKNYTFFESSGLECLLEKNKFKKLIKSNLINGVDFIKLTYMLKSHNFGSFQAMNMLMIEIFNQFYNVSALDFNFFPDETEKFFDEFVGQDFNKYFIIIDSAVQAWYENNQPQNGLIPMFDLLIRKNALPWNSLQSWNTDGEWNDARGVAMFNQYEGQSFQEWCMNLQEKYGEELEEV